MRRPGRAVVDGTSAAGPRRARPRRRTSSPSRASALAKLERQLPAGAAHDERHGARALEGLLAGLRELELHSRGALRVGAAGPRGDELAADLGGELDRAARLQAAHPDDELARLEQLERLR